MIKNIIYHVHSTWPDKRCGIATYTATEMEYAINHKRIAGIIVDAHIDEPQKYSRGNIKYITDLNSDIDIPKKINEALEAKESAKLLNSELVGYFSHEYFIFKNKKGIDFLVPLIKAYKENGILTILHPHTVLKNPEKYGPEYKPIMKEAAQYADLIIGMTPTAIEMLENIYKAPRENMIYIPHGINRAVSDLTRPQLKEKFGFPIDEDLFVSGGFFSAGKLIDQAIMALHLAEKKGDNNYHYLQVGLHKKGAENHIEKCFDVAKKLNMNPIIIGHGDDGKGLEQLCKYDLKPYKVIFLNAFLNKKDSLYGKIMSDATIIVNESDSQISSGEFVAALEAKRIPISYSSIIAEDMTKEGVGFSVKRGIKPLAKSINFFRKKANRQNLELSSAITSSRLYWDKVVNDLCDATAIIVDKKGEDYKEETFNR